MSTNGVNGPFNGDFKITLQNRGPKKSGITWELKNIFDEMRKQGKLKDADGKGLSREDALQMYETLNKIHQATQREMNYTSMQVGQEFTYTADEMTALAKAAGYELVGAEEEVTGDDEVLGDDFEVSYIPDEEEYDGGELVDEDIDQQEPPLDAKETKEQTIQHVKDHGGKVIKRDVDGLKQDIAVYSPPESNAKLRRAFNTDGTLGASLVATKTIMNNDYVTVKEDDVSTMLAEMKLKKVKIDGAEQKEMIVEGKMTDGTDEVQYYKFIPKTGHPDADGKHNRLGEQVYKVKGKYTTTKPAETDVEEKPKKKGFLGLGGLFKKKDKTTEEVTQADTTTATDEVEKPKKKNIFQKLFGKKDKTVEAEPALVAPETEATDEPKKKNFIQKFFAKKDKTEEEKPYDFNTDYDATQKIIAEAMTTGIQTNDALEQVFGVKAKKVDKMLTEIGKYSQENDISTEEGKEAVYAIAKKYGVEPGQIQAFLDSL